jgi:hypothetical protein
MVLHRDFLMRQIQQLVQVLLQVLFNKQEGNHEVARSVLDEGLKSTFKADLNELLTMERKTFMELCSPSNSFHAGLAVALADLLREEGTDPALQRARWLYEASIATGAAVSLDALEWLSGPEGKDQAS